jgi:hypothetical protein
MQRVNRCILVGMDDREMTRQEVWAVYERGAREHSREFVVMWVGSAAPARNRRDKPTEPLPFLAGR